MPFCMVDTQKDLSKSYSSASGDDDVVEAGPKLPCSILRPLGLRRMFSASPAGPCARGMPSLTARCVRFSLDVLESSSRMCCQSVVFLSRGTTARRVVHGAELKLPLGSRTIGS